ncbi:DUF4258 domain-containing protein [Aquimarina pacifica]|uniref:DUF4258 domain-containing protein n=1 Tax=Aquimarina pacifica TaxID=1296415 RepID=UPI00046F5DAA|nr:DUF4258 domain-containing protein [Aquimarina pacifica]
MNLGQRFFYYLSGFAIGLILLFFFLGGKKASCDYTPSARVLKNIRIKKKEYSSQALTLMQKFKIDTSHITELLLKGDVDFSKSNTKLDSCKVYHLEGLANQKPVTIIVRNCDSIAKIDSITLSK